ncbi:beta-adaptin-like protein A isoform X2 [Triticum aestivum]|uniref:beta-adaptin-like protein A isoform X2 n=1 Tax=Triticum aestivum TaxID=4565 RepID=UPI001D02ACC3|nr:beta-adaptin-like protein A isoform X2 [Triticum aestivum]
MAPTAPSPAKSASPSQPSGKSEVSDLKQQLRQLAGSRAPDADDQRRDVFKRVISCMTAGIDVSAAFGEMVLCSATSDVVLKKMCYLYVGVHARAHPDLALLTINFLQRDCRDQDPTIRGLALRSLCSLRVPNLVEYLVTPLTTGLKDPSAYVRMVAAVGAAKLYHISATTCLDADLPAALKALMLSDPDAQVVANCLHSLLEIWTLEAANSEAAGREIETLYSKPVVFYLLNKIKEFSEWAQCHVLELASKFIPSDNNEIFDIMNLLEDRLQHANGAVVLATIKVFLHLTMSMTDVHQQVYERIKAPLLTLVGAGSPEQSYSVLCHLHLLVMRAPMLFSSDYKSFYCQFSDPSYVKKLKLEMLTAIANESNTYEIVTELCEYAGNVDVPIARESIRAVGKIALQQYDVNAIVDRLLQFLEMDKDYVTAETLVLVKDLLRKYPQWSHDCIAVVGNISSQNIQEPKGKAALIWMLGEYSQDMHDAPYVLENLVDNWDEEQSPEPSYMFTDKEHRGTFEYSEDLANLTVGADAPETVISAQRYQENDNDLLLSTSDKEDNGIRSSNGSYTSTYNAPSDLLSSQTPAETALINPSSSTYSTQTNFSLDDLLGLGVPDASAPPPPPALALNSKPVLDPATFQKKWGQLALSFSQECSLSLQGAASLMNPQSLIRHMQSNYIQCIASGGQPPNYKFYFYGQKAGAAAFYLVECIVNTASAKAQLKIKAEDGTTAEAFSTLFQSVLSQFGHS